MDNKDIMKKENSKKISRKSVITILLILLIVGIIIVLALILKKDKNKNDETGENVEPTATTTPVRYDSNIIVGKDDAASDEVGNVEDGQMNLEMKDVAISKDGKNFSCYICNAKENAFDMFFTIRDPVTNKDIYKSGLIPVGARIETFKIDNPIDKGKHRCVLIYHQMESDGTTEHATVSVEITLKVD